MYLGLFCRLVKWKGQVPVGEEKTSNHLHAFRASTKKAARRFYVIRNDSLFICRRRNPGRTSRPDFKSPERAPNNPTGKGGRPKSSSKKSTLKKERQARAKALKSPEVIEKRAETHRNKTTRNRYRDKLRKNPTRRELFDGESLLITYRKPAKKKKIHVLSTEKVSDKFDEGKILALMRLFFAHHLVQNHWL